MFTGAERLPDLPSLDRHEGGHPSVASDPRDDAQLAVGLERDDGTSASRRADPLVVLAAARVGPCDAQRATALGRARALARHQLGTADLEHDPAIRDCLDADDRGPVLGTYARGLALPADGRRARTDNHGSDRDRGPEHCRRESDRGVRPAVADSMDVRTRRRNHGRSIPAAELADKALRSIVPGDRLRLVRVQIAWVDMLPARLAKVASPVAIDGETLVVHVVDNQWLHELQYLRADLLDRIREGAPLAGVSALRLRVGEVAPLPAPGARDVVATSPALPLQPGGETLDAIASVVDDGLRSTIATARQALTRLGRGGP